MIFVVVGTQKFQFNRLLENIDLLIEKGIIKDEVFAQIGYSSYKPLNYNYLEFMTKEKYNDYLDRSSIVLCHGGTGTIVNSISKGKKVIAIPRLSKFNEHVDDHQKEIVKQFANSNYILEIENITQLKDALCKVNKVKFNKFTSNTKKIINIIEEFIEDNNI